MVHLNLRVDVQHGIAPDPRCITTWAMAAAALPICLLSWGSTEGLLEMVV